MQLEELVKKISLKDLKIEAKKHGISISCKTKMDIAKDLPKEVLEKLAKSSKIKQRVIHIMYDKCKNMTK